MGFDTTILPNAFLMRVKKEDRPKGPAGMTAEEALASATVRSEKELQQLIENYCRLKSIPCFRQRMDRKSNMPIGTPDILACFKGKFIAVEVKVGSNHPTPDQTKCLEQIEAAGGSAVVVRSLPEFIQILK